MKNTVFATRSFLLLLFTVFALAIFGSAPVHADHRAVIGAIIGGTTGALVGDSMGGRDGAIVGGALGAVAGAALSEAHYRPNVGYLPPPPYYRPPSGFAPAPVYYPRHDRDWERRRWEHRHNNDQHRRDGYRDWDRDGYRR
jgi:hypothetical protein